MKEWRDEMGSSGIHINYDMNQQLIRGYEKKKALNEWWWNYTLRWFCSGDRNEGKGRRSHLKFCSHCSSLWFDCKFWKAKLIGFGPTLGHEETADVEKSKRQRTARQIFQISGVFSISWYEARDGDNRKNKGRGHCFGALREAVFQSPHIAAKTRTTVFRAMCCQRCCTVPLDGHVSRHVTFTNQCQLSMLGINILQQRLESLTSKDIPQKLGCLETFTESMTTNRLRWLTICNVYRWSLSA